MSILKRSVAYFVFKKQNCKVEKSAKTNRQETHIHLTESLIKA